MRLPGSSRCDTLGADKKPQFISYGATLTNLFVKDKQGKDVDVVLGYDDVDFYRRSLGPLAPLPFLRPHNSI